MIRCIRGSLLLTYSQTLNVYGLVVVCVNIWEGGVSPLCGPFLVSRTGDEG